jgi:long-chain acyl-CoA synthetase
VDTPIACAARSGEATRMQTTSTPAAQGDARTVATTILGAARNHGGVAMRMPRDGSLEETSHRALHDRAREIARGLIALGVEPGDRVAIHSENRREWLYSDLGIVAVRAITMGLYPTNPAPEVRYLLENSGSKVLIAEDQEQLDKALEVIDDLPELEWIVYVDHRGIRGRYDDPRLISWDDFLARGRAHRAADDGAVERRMDAAEPDDIMTLVYTSGTTGPPKGAMLSVANVEFAIKVLVEGGGFSDPPPNPDDVILSYLPLCHVAERVFTIWFNAAVGVQVNFAESIETVQQNLKEIQPTILFGVPRIWEKILAGVNIRMASASWIKRTNYKLWMGVADKIGSTLVRTGGVHTATTRFLYALGYVFLFRALRDRIGMRKVRYAASGAAPIAPDILRFFMGLGVPMHEVYGMTENTAVATANRAGRVMLGTVGEAHDEVEIRIDPDTGEIQTRSPGNFVGYWRNEQATAETFTDDGWLKTGDVGEWVEGTHLKITDRMKDIIITAGGKNISPSEIENALKASPYIKEAIVIGDRRKYLTALIGIELDTVGNWAQRRRLPYTTYRDLTQKPEVLELVQKIVDTTNERFASVEQVKRFELLPKELDHDEGELTATQKVKRTAVIDQFSGLVEKMYGGKA